MAEWANKMADKDASCHPDSVKKDWQSNQMGSVPILISTPFYYFSNICNINIPNLHPKTEY